MIPKVIHYCWFGRNPLPPLAIKCINSWKKFFPDYEIKEWNEDNFDVNIIPYTKEAYEMRKYAFVSDYARFWILYRYGGLYFDTDVEVIKPMDDIIAKGAFMGCENGVKDETPLFVAPGLGLGCEAKHPVYADLLKLYSQLHFLQSDSSLNFKTVVQYTTEYFEECGLKKVNTVQLVNGTWIYPQDYFCPKSPKDGKIYLTDNTYTIHHFSASWVSPYEKFVFKVGKIIGKNNLKRLVAIKRMILRFKY